MTILKDTTTKPDFNEKDYIGVIFADKRCIMVRRAFNEFQLATSDFTNGNYFPHFSSKNFIDFKRLIVNDAGVTFIAKFKSEAELFRWVYNL